VLFDRRKKRVQIDMEMGEEILGGRIETGLSCGAHGGIIFAGCSPVGRQ